MVLYNAVEPDRYQEWRTYLSTDPIKALTTANGRDKDCLVFFSNTEERLTPMKGTASGSSATESTSPADQLDEYAFGWDKDEGVYFVQLNEDIRERLKGLLQMEFRHWNDALAECGAEYHSNCMAYIPLWKAMNFNVTRARFSMESSCSGTAGSTLGNCEAVLCV